MKKRLHLKLELLYLTKLKIGTSWQKIHIKNTLFHDMENTNSVFSNFLFNIKTRLILLMWTAYLQFFMLTMTSLTCPSWSYKMPIAFMFFIGSSWILVVNRPLNGQLADIIVAAA